MCPNALIWEDSCFLGVGIVLLARPRLPLYLLSAFQRCAASVSLASLHPDPKSIPREDSLLGKCLATQKKHTHGIVLNPNSTVFLGQPIDAIVGFAHSSNSSANGVGFGGAGHSSGGFVHIRDV